MKAEIIKEWKFFVAGKDKLFNAPALPEQIKKVENKLNFKIPDDLKTLYLLTNGQQDFQQKGVFKNVSGFDVYSRVFFLPVQQLPLYYAKTFENESMMDSFGKEFLPFAVEFEQQLGYSYAISLKDNGIYMLWTDLSDPHLPADWQLSAIRRGKGMFEFLQFQHMLFRKF